MRSTLSLVYVIVGAVVANQHNYFVPLTTLSRALSAALAVILWPLIILHIPLHINLT